MKKLLVLLLLLATPAFALDKEAEESLNVAATIMAFRDLCEKTSFSERVYRDSYQETVQKSGLSEDAVLKRILDKTFELTTAIESQDRVEFFCSYVRETFEESKAAAPTQAPPELAAKPTYAETFLQKKGMQILDSIIVGAIGGVIGLALGWIIKRFNGRNLNTETWWLVSWTLGFTVLMRALANAI